MTRRTAHFHCRSSSITGIFLLAPSTPVPFLALATTRAALAVAATLPAARAALDASLGIVETTSGASGVGVATASSTMAILAGGGTGRRHYVVLVRNTDLSVAFESSTARQVGTTVEIGTNTQEARSSSVVRGFVDRRGGIDGEDSHQQ